MAVEGIASLRRLRQARPHLPVLIVAKNVEPDVAVEVCRILGMDFLSSPNKTPDELRYKCERVLLGRQGPTLLRPYLATLVPEAEGAAIARSVPNWGKDARLDLDVSLAEEPHGLRVACRVVRVPKPVTQLHFHFAVEYHTQSARDAFVFMRFWTNCQMQARRRDKDRLGIRR